MVIQSTDSHTYGMFLPLRDMSRWQHRKIVCALCPVHIFHARVVQHESDHLWGKLYPMRVRDFTQFGYTDVLFPELGDIEADD